MKPNFLKFSTLVLMIIAYIISANAQTYILQEDFSSLSKGNNTSSTGANTSWSGDANFPTVTNAYQAGGAVKLGTGSLAGSIISKTLDLSVNGGSFNVSFDVKGWTSVEGSIIVTVSGLSAQTITYSATMSSTTFDNKVLSFTGGTANSTITIETTSKRAYIDNVNVYFTATCTLTNLAFTKASVSKIVTDSKFTQSATSLNTAAAITYSSSATSVANVNSTTGEVTIAGVGTTNIIANQAASGSYCASSSSYSLTVTPLPTLTLTDVTNLNLNSTVSNEVSQTINIAGVNLSTDLGIVLSGPDAGLFTLSQYSISQSGGTAPNTSLTLTYKPTSVGSHAATLTLTSTGAIDVTRSITGNAILAADVTETLVSNLSVFVENMCVKFNATAGKTIDIYNAIGQKLVHGLTVEGLNSIPLSSHGVVLIKVGNQQKKVIL